MFLIDLPLVVKQSLGDRSVLLRSLGALSLEGLNDLLSFVLLSLVKSRFYWFFFALPEILQSGVVPNRG